LRSVRYLHDGDVLALEPVRRGFHAARRSVGQPDVFVQRPAAPKRPGAKAGGFRLAGRQIVSPR
jgi:hypothetical protein